jgi:putative ABC transport system ATP-binding protein
MEFLNSKRKRLWKVVYRAMLKVKQLSKVFNPNTINENRVFDKLYLDVEQGDFISIIGSNGAGKSTLLNMISGTIEADSGSILLDGSEVINKPEHVRSKSIGRVFQNPSMGVAPNMTILENVALADNKGKTFGLGFGINKKRIDYYKEMVSELDLGLEDKIYNKVLLLSGGQRQALTLLMAVMSRPKLLLLDEHTAALDPKTSEKIMDITRNIVKDSGITTLMVTHNLKHALENGNRLFMMHRGQILVDIKGEEKEKLDTNKLLGLFEKANVTDGLSDRTLFE